MDVTFVANDTRGGVEPYLAFAAEAVSRGHAVRVVAPPQYADEARALGVTFAALSGADQAREIAATGRVSMREMSRRVVDLTAQWAAETATAAQGTDVMVSGIGGMAIARPVAQAVGARLLRAHLQPLEAPSSHYPGPLAPQLSTLGPIGRRVSHTVTAAGTSLLTRAPERAARDALGLARAAEPALPTIVYGFSGAVVPVVSDAATMRVATGWWSLNAVGVTDPRVVEFVERPGPVISIGFGSMLAADPAALRTLVTAAAQRAGARVVLITGWGALGEQSDNDGGEVLTVGSVAHSWLFPRMTATVHHGGAGTTGAALRAGVPSVVVPFGADQPFWATRAHRLGVTPHPIPRARLTEERLTAALRLALTDKGLRTRARTLGDTLLRDRGAEAAVDVLETAVRGRG